MPEDDNTWPLCDVHRVRHWCQWTRDFLIEGSDAANMCDGLRYCVPAVPSYDLYAEVSIGNEVIPGMAYSLALVIETSVFGSNSEELLDLGLWSPGEGRLVISAAIQDWADGYAEPKCIQTTHGFEQEMKHQAALKSQPDYAQADLWCMAYYKACYQCKLVQDNKQATAPVVNFDAASFGLDGFRGAGTAPANARQDRAREALRQRFGNRAMAVEQAVRTGQVAMPLGDNSYKAGDF